MKIEIAQAACTSTAFSYRCTEQLFISERKMRSFTLKMLTGVISMAYKPLNAAGVFGNMKRHA